MNNLYEKMYNMRANDPPSASNTPEKPEVPKNTIAQVLKVIGWIIIILGVVYGFVLGFTKPTADEINYPNLYSDSEQFNAQALAISSITGTIAGLLFIAISEIITLLFKNLNAQNKLIDLLFKCGKEE